MSSKLIAAPLPNFAEGTSLAQHLRSAIRSLLKGFVPVSSSAERVLVIEDRVGIGPKKSLVVVRCHGQSFLVAIAGDSIGPLVEIAVPKAARRPRQEREA